MRVIYLCEDAEHNAAMLLADDAITTSWDAAFWYIGEGLVEPYLGCYITMYDSDLRGDIFEVFDDTGELVDHVLVTTFTGPILPPEAEPIDTLVYRA
jgi:hypothetical protein